MSHIQLRIGNQHYVVDRQNMRPSSGGYQQPLQPAGQGDEDGPGVLHHSGR